MLEQPETQPVEKSVPLPQKMEFFTVAFDNPAGDWILHQGSNSIRCRRTVDGLSEAISTLAVDGELRQRLGTQALKDIATGHSDWSAAFDGVYEFLSDPEHVGRGA